MELQASDFKKDLVLILMVSILVSFVGIWKIPVSRNQEARIAVSARETLQHGHWLIPTFNNQVRLQKPPLMTWMVALSYRLFGQINEFTLRAPSYLFSLASGLFIYLFGRKLFGRYAGIMSALILLTSFEFIRHSRLAEIDMALLLTISGALGCWYLALTVEPVNRLCLMTGYLLCAVAVNLKGPVGLIIPVTACLGFLLTTRQYAKVKKWLNPVGLLGCLILSCAWYGFAFFRESQAYALFKHELDVTFIKGSDHPGPFYYYLYILFRCFAPWTIFMYGAVLMALRKKEKNLPEVFVLTWLMLTFALLSFNPNKQPHYSLLLLPPMALMTGWMADKVRPILLGARQVFRRSEGVVAVLVGLTIAGALLDTFFFHSKTAPKSVYAQQLAWEINRKVIEKAPLYSYGFSAGAVAFYSGRSIPVISQNELEAKKKERRTFFVIVEEKDASLFTDGEISIPVHTPAYPLAVVKLPAASRRAS